MPIWDREEYDSEYYLNECAYCGSVDNFRRFRAVREMQWLSLDDGYAELSDSEYEDEDYWRYECGSCNRDASELEDLLAQRPEDEPEDITDLEDYIPDDYRYERDR